jgi:hydrogenase expression/formation protein HypE
MTFDYINGTIEMAHGSGGRASSQLIDELFLPAFDNPVLCEKNDQAVLIMPGKRIVMATDSHVISPLFFPGGDIGSLAVYGTVNDVCMSGATPLYLSVGFILEEGFPLADLKRIVESMASAAKRCGTAIVTGDTKVVERGKGDGCFINTTGIGALGESLNLSPAQIQAGDKILVSGTLGDHGTTILAQRQHLNLSTALISDSQPLHDLVAKMLETVPDIKCLRDPTRGGLSAILNELAQASGFAMQLNDSGIPIKEQVKACCELLGLDPLCIANEGKLVAFCPADKAEELLAVMKQHPQGQDAAIIGEVLNIKRPLVEMNTCFGGKRIIDWRYSDPLPRIC